MATEYLNIKKNNDIDVNVPTKPCIDSINASVSKNTSDISTMNSTLTSTTSQVSQLTSTVNELSEKVSGVTDVTCESIGAVPIGRKINGLALTSDINLAASNVGAVSNTRTINGKPLTSNVSLTASDVGAVPTSRTVNGRALSSNITLTASDVSAVPTTRTVCGKALSSNITLTAANVSAVPTTRKVNNKALSSDISLTYSDVSAVPTSRTVNGKALSANISLTAANVGALATTGGTLSGQLRCNHSTYPQIYGNGTVLQLSGSNGESSYAVVIDYGRADDSNALRPAIDAGQTGHMHCGNSNHRWRDVFSRNGAIQTSDRNEKNTIEPLDEELAKNFIMGIKPSTYKFNNPDSGRTHWGMISQDIEELLSKIGLTSMDFAGFIKSPKTEEHYEDVTKTITDEEGKEETVTEKELKIHTLENEYIYSLRYDEFIAPLISVVQTQQKQIEQLTERIAELEKLNK